MSIRSFVALVGITFAFGGAFAGASPAHRGLRWSSRSMTELRYSRSHSLGEDYSFDPRDGWVNVTTSDLSYKYAQPSGNKSPASRDVPEENTGFLKRRVKSLTGAIQSALKGLKAIGKPEDVTITWYTGHDLQNPSCWPNTNWAPTDDSFACALTMDGWKEKPKCFKFVELCNTPSKCVFVRVVDTCAGCAKGSKHVDLTRAAFGQLADYDQGVLKVKMRMATDPDDWSEKLWGPKA